MARDRHTVWSSDDGRTCPDCGSPVAGCTCGDEAVAPVGDGVVRVGREAKGRRGKTVTVVRGLPLAAGELEDLARELKKACGVGGAVKGGVVEIQGEKREQVARLLRERGFTVKVAGG
ncbi:translation initiation factor Sui1 [bacterium]|nr:translation initiation factor Sui1 [bacterium]